MFAAAQFLFELPVEVMKEYAPAMMHSLIYVIIMWAAALFCQQAAIKLSLGAAMLVM